MRTITISTLLASLLVLALLAAAGPRYPTSMALAGIHAYQDHIAPLAARAGIRCRFTPTCSRYAEVVIARDGVFTGGWKAAKRIARCGPWTPPGTSDPP